MLHFICNKASFSFSMFRKVCISSLMNAELFEMCLLFKRGVLWNGVRLLTTISVGTYHFVSSICSQKHFWFSYTSVDYSFACSHIPIPLSLPFLLNFVLQFLHDFVFLWLFYLCLLCDYFHVIIQKSLFHVFPTMKHHS